MAKAQRGQNAPLKPPKKTLLTCTCNSHKFHVDD